VIVVEHDEETIRSADHVIDVGRAGLHGGEIVAQGSVADIVAEKRRSRGRFFSGEEEIPLPAVRRKPDGPASRSRGRARTTSRRSSPHPAGCFVAVTGVSGSGRARSSTTSSTAPWPGS